MSLRQESKGRAFTFGELWTGGQGGWPCTGVDADRECREITPLLEFSAKEMEQIISFGIANHLEGEGLLPETIVYIMDNNLGTPRCGKHCSVEIKI